MDSQDQVLRSKIVRLVKVLWKHRGMEEATWEPEDTVPANYPFLFDEEVITTQIVLFHTLNTLGFEHFLCSNQPN